MSRRGDYVEPVVYGNWQSLTLHADKAEAAKEKAKMHRHWNRLRAKGIDV